MERVKVISKIVDIVIFFGILMLGLIFINSVPAIFWVECDFSNRCTLPSTYETTPCYLKGILLLFYIIVLIFVVTTL